jgi:uncharacterized repeat protein (TIGR01451 family)
MMRRLAIATMILTSSSVAMAQPMPIVNNTTQTKQVSVIRLVLGAVGPGVKPVGQTATYTITLQNTGDTPARQVLLTHELPAGFRFVSSEGARFDAATRRVTWFWNELTPGSKKEVHVNAEAVNAGEWTHKLEAHDERGTRVQTDFPVRVESPAPAQR